MYKLYKCSVLTKKYNYYFDVIDESRDKAESRAIHYVVHKCKDNELFGGGSSGPKDTYSEKSIKLIEYEADEKPPGV